MVMSVVVPNREKAGPLQAAVAQTKQHIRQLALCMGLRAGAEV